MLEQEEERPRPDSSSTAEVSLKIYQAAQFQSHVRLECDMLSGTLHITDGSVRHQFRLDSSTMLCLADVMSRYYDEQWVRRGRKPESHGFEKDKK